METGGGSSLADVPEVVSTPAEGGEGSLNEVIEHWVTVLDQWVNKFDRERGATRKEDGADPSGEAGSPTGPAPAPPD